MAALLEGLWGHKPWLRSGDTNIGYAVAGRFVGTQTLAKRTPWLRVHLGCAMQIEGLWEHKPWLIGDTNLG